MRKPKLIGWIKDAKYPAHSLGVSFTVSTSEEKIIERAKALAETLQWQEHCVPPYVLTVTTYGMQKTKLTKVLETAIS